MEAKTQTNTLFFVSQFSCLVKISCICWMIAWPSTDMKAQVIIGLETDPIEGALLDIKTKNSTQDGTTSTQGVLYPRVKLTDATKLTPTIKGDPNKDEKKEHTGLIVYNVAETGKLKRGLYIWNGEMWRKIDDKSLADKPLITSLELTQAVMTPNKYTANKPFMGILKVPYSGGSGGEYLDGVPTQELNNNGLTIQLLGGKLNKGGGELLYLISGTPNISSPITSNFNVHFQGNNWGTVNVGNASSITTLNYIRKTVELNSATTNASVISLGNVNFRYYYNSQDSLIQFSVNQDMHLSYLHKRMGAGDTHVGMRFAKLSAKKNQWYDFSDSSGEGWSSYIPELPAYLGYFVLDPYQYDSIPASLLQQPISYVHTMEPSKSAIATAIIVLQNDEVQEIYRATFNAYLPIPAAPATVPKSSTNRQPAWTPIPAVTRGLVSIFVERL